MADIGSALRETRIRKKIDISSVEAATKIRAKYLRALENEEWGVLPGPTYVKSFLRTYAEYLGLDPYVLIEEFNTRFEEPEELEVPAFQREEPIRDQVRRFGPPSRGTVAIVVAVGFVAFLLILGLWGGSNKNDKGSNASGTNSVKASSESQTQPAPVKTKPKPPATPAGQVAVQVAPSRQVWVCLIDSKGTRRVNAEVLSAGQKRGPFHSKRFEVTVGNGGGDLVIDGKRRNVPERSSPLGYAITPGAVKVLSQADQPSCQ